MNKKLQYIILTLLSIFFISGGSEASAQKVELSVQSGYRNNRIPIGEKFQIYVTLKNVNQAPSQLNSVGGAELIYWAEQSSRTSISSINGKMTQTSESVYVATLIARKKGAYSVGPLTVGGVKSNIVKYSIVDASEASPSGGRGQQTHSDVSSDADDADPNVSPTAPDPNGGPTFIGKGDDKLFLRASVSKTTAYEQEALVYTVKLFTTYGSIKFIGSAEAPKFEGFVIEESNNVSNQLSTEVYQGRTYATAVIARYIIFPQMSGKLKIKGNSYTVSTDANEYYHDPFFSMLTVRRPIQLNVAPNDLEINVKPLPTPRPANFSGGVGQFNITSSLKSDKVVANQAGSVTYTVTGSGNLKYIHLPDLNALYPDEIEVFSPTTDVQTNVGIDNVTGSVKFDYSFMPLEQGEFNIPDVELVYFNPSTGQYETARTKGYRLNVAKGEESSKSQSTLTFSSKLMPVDVDESPETRPYIRGFLYWLWFIIPAVLLIVTAIARRKYIVMQSDVVGMRTRRAGKMAKRRLKKAAAAMKSKNEELFYDEILKAIWGYLSDKLQLPTSELTRDNVSQVLESRGIEAAKIDNLLKLLDECEFAKYSPASSRKPMSEIYDESTGMLNSLEESFTRKSVPDKKGEDGDNPDSSNNSDVAPSSNSGSSSTSSSGIISVLAMIIISAFSAWGAPSATTVAMADSAYSKGDFPEAIKLYEKQIEQQGATASLLFNLGCSYYKSGNEGEARLCMERAKRLDPSNSRINQNLQYLENRINDANKAEVKGRKGNVVPDNLGFFGRVNKKISADTSSDTWASFAAMAFILLILSLGVYIFSRNVQVKKIGFFSSFIFFGFSVIFVIFSEMAASRFMSKDEAIVTEFKVTLLKDPHDEKSEIGSPLVRGTKLEILESQLNSDGDIGWYKVELNRHIVGWVAADAVSII